MNWDNIIESHDENEVFEDYVRSFLGSGPVPLLPKTSMRIGPTDAMWFETEPGYAHIFVSGGTVDDRRYARAIVKAALEGHNIKPQSYGFERDHSDTSLNQEEKEVVEHIGNVQHFSTWADIEAKAKRLIQSGKVQILRNAPDVIVGYVEGDHGNYQVEIHRDDPNSQAISLWSCECDWDQYAWGRTRQWKKYEGRPCLLQKSLISMADGSFKPIADVKVDDFVVTHNGIGKVTEAMRRPYDGLILSITSAGLSSHPLEITPQHEVWGYGTPQRLKKMWQDQKEQGFKFYDESFILDNSPDWIESQHLKRHDWLTSPIRETTSGATFDIKSIIPSDWSYDEENGRIWRTYKRHAKQKRYQGSLDRYIRPSKALMTVLGLYVSEGHIIEVQGHPGQIQWSFALHEQETLGKNLEVAIREIDPDADLSFYPRPQVGAISYRLTHHVLALVLSALAGRYSQHKEWHSWIMNLSPDDQEELLYWHRQGDGSENKKDSRWRIDTSSDNLAFQTADMLIRCGRNPFISKRKQKGGPTNRKKICWINRISWVDDPQYTNGIRRRDEWGYITNKITNIDEHTHDGYVYNLAVEPQQSYVANGRIVHNCSHVLSTYWLSQTMPLDEETEPGGEEPQGPPGTVPPGAAPSMTPGMTPPLQPALSQPAPQEPVPGQAPEPTQLIPPYPNAPEMMPAINPVSVPGQKPAGPLNPIQWPGGTFSSVKEADQQYVNGDMVQLKNQDYGEYVGLGGGGHATIPANSIGEVLGTDAVTGLINVLYSGKVTEGMGKLQPHGVICWNWPSDVIRRDDIRKPGPAVRRRV